MQAILPSRSLSQLNRGRSSELASAAFVRPFDGAVARFFSELRRHLGLPRHVIAAQLGTTETVLAALEMGHIADLPQGDALAQLVTRYTGQLRLDPLPILSLIKSLQVAAAPALPVAAVIGAVSAPASTAPAGAFDAEAAEFALALAAERVAEDDDWIRQMSASVQQVEEQTEAAALQAHRRARRRRRVSKTMAIVTASLTVSGLAWALVPHASKVYPAIDGLPSVIVAPVRNAYNAVLMAIAPEREELRWIEVDDPKARRTDKLPNSGNSL